MTARKTKRRGQGEGSIYQRKSDGKWVAAVTLPGGGRKYAYGDSQDEAIAKRDKIKRDMAVGVLPDNATVSEWMDHYFDVILPTKDRHASTIDRNRGYSEIWIKPLLGSIKLQDLQVDHVRLMIRRMQQATSKRTGEPLSARTIIKARAVLQAALTQAERDGRVVRNVAKFADPPKLRAEPSLPKLTTDQARKVIDSSTDCRERARLAVALMAGLRQGEALALRWEHVILDPNGKGGIVEVRESATRVRGQGMAVGTPKTLRSVRDVDLSPAAAQMLLAWRQESGGTGYVFGHKIKGVDEVEDSRRDYELWRVALRRAGVPHVRLHDARGTAESHMASVVPPWVAAEMMGHDEKVGRRYYNRSTREQRQLAAAGTEAIAGPSRAVRIVRPGRSQAST
jgi:integrase